MPWRGPTLGHAFAPVIVFIPRSGDGCKPGEYDSEWLPRQCPGCGEFHIIGHGRRCRQAHDRLHDSIRVRRGFCKQCHGTLTVLPCWCVPLAHYNLPARQEAIRSLAENQSIQQAAPECRDPERIADVATIRRWLARRIESLAVGATLAWNLFLAPTLLAWDFRAALRILILEQAPP